VATALLAPLVADTFDEATLGRLMASALDFPMPLVPLAPDLAVLELFHGPTLAFKDVGARTMARWLAVVAGADDTRPLTVLVATSGDTGGAVAHAFHGVAGTRVVVLYPRGRVSPVQEAQFATLGGNVTAVAVDGVFDDCQRMVKEAFADADLARALRLTSANSINISRIFAQVCYYFEAFAQLSPAQRRQTVFAVPSGNFGNLTAGLIAKVLGLPIKRFIAATNSNDTVPRFLQDGRWQPHATQATLSNAMDVSNPNNWPRIQHLLDQGLIDADELSAVAISEAETAQAVRDLDALGYLSEPHAALA